MQQDRLKDYLQRKKLEANNNNLKKKEEKLNKQIKDNLDKMVITLQDVNQNLIKAISTQ